MRKKLIVANFSQGWVDQLLLVYLAANVTVLRLTWPWVVSREWLCRSACFSHAAGRICRIFCVGA